MPDHIYVYPSYLSKGISRSDGRRVDGAQAIAEPTAEMIVGAARALGFTAEVESEKQYPRRFYEYGGRVKIAKRPGVTKTRLLKMLADEIRRHPPPAGPP